jgi:hypothetical protein
MLDRLRLLGVGPREPAPQCEGVTGRLKEGAAVDDRLGVVHPEPHPLDDRGEMPRIDQPPVGCGLAADRVEPAAPAPGGGKRMSGQQGVEARDGGSGLLELAGKRSQPFESGRSAISPLRREFARRECRHWRRRRQRMWRLTVTARQRRNADEPAPRVSNRGFVRAASGGKSERGMTSTYGYRPDP